MHWFYGTRGQRWGSGWPMHWAYLNRDGVTMNLRFLAISRLWLHATGNPLSKKRRGEEVNLHRELSLAEQLRTKKLGDDGAHRHV